MSGTGSPVVVAVVVAFNRRELLAQTLEALQLQTSPPDAIVVIDNASTDGSAEVARRMAPRADVVSLTTNTGGAGGFAAGIARAVVRHHADLVWVMDDDTVPTEGALSGLLAARNELPGARLLASRVVWTDGRDHPMNTPRRTRLTSRATAARLQEIDAFAFRSASFVSLLIPAALVRSRGLPIADYFLWNDDFEYSTRLVRGGRGIYARRSVVEHRTKAFSGIEVDPGERFYFEVRNKVWMFRWSSSLSTGEKAIYGASSLLRWFRVLARSHDRPTLFDALRRGLRTGFAQPPRTNQQVFEDEPEVSGDVATIERVAHA